jgi:S-adenosylhomocysteine hydrolase
MRKYRRGKKVMRGGIINSWVRQNMNENEQGAFISLLYKAFPGIDTDEITNLSTQDEVAQAIHTKIQNMKLTPNEEDVLYTEFEHFFR